MTLCFCYWCSVFNPSGMFLFIWLKCNQKSILFHFIFVYNTHSNYVSLLLWFECFMLFCFCYWYCMCLCEMKSILPLFFFIFYFFLIKGQKRHAIQQLCFSYSVIFITFCNFFTCIASYFLYEQLYNINLYYFNLILKAKKIL